MDPLIAQKGPYLVEEPGPGVRFWCACGRSASQPFCDGSHKGTGLTPVRVELSEGGKVWYCGCKATGNAPRCDGSHNRL